MASRKNVVASGKQPVLVFPWGADGDAALAKARDAGCVLGLWFKLAQQRDKFHRDFAAWLKDVHQKYRARFGVVTMKTILGLTLMAGTALVAMPDAQAADGNWLVRGRILHMQVDNGNDPEVAGAKVELNDKTFPELDITYFFTRHIAAELILTYPQKHDVLLNGSKIGTVKHLPPTLTLQYHFAPGATIRPYVGAGVNYTHISSVDLPAGVDVERSSTGAAFQIGADVKMAEKWFLNVDLKKVYIETDVSAGGSKLTTLKIDPLLFSIGAGYRF